MLHLKSIKWLNIFLQISLFVGVLLSLFLYTKPSTYTVAQSCRSGCYWNGGIGRCTGPNGCTNTGVSGCGGCQACFDGYCCDRGSCGSCTPGNCSTGYVEGGSGGNGCSGSHKSCNRTYCTGGNCGTTTRYCWLIKYTLTYSAGEGGTLGGSTSQSICRNSNGTAVSANPSEGYVFVDWSDSSTANPRTDTSVTADIDVTANFLLINTPPLSPTNLKVENATNPTGVADTTPEFKATFQDEDPEDTALYYEIDVNTNNTFTGTVMWASGKTELPSPVGVGEESSEISYAGSALSLNGSTYYWRIRFWDGSDAESPWSDTANFKMNTAPSAPTSLLAEGTTNPVGIADLTPEFSAIFNDPDTGNTGTYYEIQVNTNTTFTGTVMWSSGQTSMTEIAIGSRSPEISYAGTALSLNGSTYYWRIRFTDNYGTVGEWSSAANFKMNGSPTAPTSLQTDGEENPIYILSATPKFTAIHNDPNLQNASAYEIHVNSNSTFTGTVMWNSGKIATSVVSGERSPEYQYAGTTLELNHTVYYWRIRFWDTDDMQGEWSQTATFAASVNRQSFTFKGLLMKGIQLR